MRVSVVGCTSIIYDCIPSADKTVCVYARTSILVRHTWYVRVRVRARSPSEESEKKAEKLCQTDALGVQRSSANHPSSSIKSSSSSSSSKQPSTYQYIITRIYCFRRLLCSLLPISAVVLLPVLLHVHVRTTVCTVMSLLVKAIRTYRREVHCYDQRSLFFLPFNATRQSD